MKTIRALTGSAIFFFALAVIYYFHINYFKVDVVFYAAIFDGVLAAIIVGGVLWGGGFFRPLGTFEKSLLIFIWLITGYTLAISVPTVIDRSLSFYILEKIQQRGGGIRQDAFEKIFIQEYMKEHRLVDVRLTEQIQSGTIEIENGCVLLTPKGDMIAAFSRNFRQHWLPKQRLLLGEYSDDLTDPFRTSSTIENYTCTR
ncbi:MAG: hypothetical protein ACOX5Z_03040 [Desulfobulbus sp.]|jgi:hypothetical protein